MAYNTVGQDSRTVNQGARPTEKTENERAALADASTGEVEATENSENKRVATVVYA